MSLRGDLERTLMPMDQDRGSVLAEAARLRLGPTDDGRLVSASEFAAAAYAEPYRYERVEGRLSVMSPDGWEHVATSEPWRDHLVAYKLARPDLVRRVVSQAWVRIDGGKDRIGDMGVYLAGDTTGLKIPDLVPDLMFEFVSPSAEDRRRDYVAKRADYQRIGVREYVIVDRWRYEVTVLTLGPEGYTDRVIAGDGVYDSPLLPGLAIRLAEVWSQ